MWDLGSRLLGDFATLTGRLYEKHDRPELLPFLVVSRHYTLRDARDLLSRAQPPLLHELAHVVHRMGDSEAAIRILVHDARDVRAALVLAEQLSDAPTWQFLIQTTIATGSGELLGALLDGVCSVSLGGGAGGAVTSSYADILRRIPGRVCIPQLQTRLLALLRDRRIATALVAGCDSLVRGDMHALVARKDEVLRAGLRVDAGVTCVRCEKPLVGLTAAGPVDPRRAHGTAASAASAAEGRDRDNSASVFFFCHHAFHWGCLLAQVAAADAEAKAAASRPRSRSRSSSVSSWYGGSAGIRAGMRRGSSAAGAGGAFDMLPSSSGVGAAAAEVGGQPEDDDGGEGEGVGDREVAPRCPICTHSQQAYR